MTTGGGALAVAPYPAEWDDVGETDAKKRDHRAEWRRRKSKEYGRACDLRERLRSVLGGKCPVCGSTEELEFHHPKGRTWQPRKLNLLARMRRYWRDFSEGRLSLLCSPCNKKVGDVVGYWQRNKKRRAR